MKNRNDDSGFTEHGWKDIHLELDGMSRVIIENYKAILFCSPNEFVIKGSNQKIDITGANMTICHFDELEIMIHGCIQNIKMIRIDS